MFSLLPERHLGTYRISLEILYRHWKTKGGIVTLSNVVAARAGVGVKAKWRALKELEHLGLIKVIRRPRRSPEVIVLDTTD